jgi:hypothetical protein
MNARPGDMIRIMPDRALAHLFDAETGIRMSMN